MHVEGRMCVSIRMRLSKGKSKQYVCFAVVIFTLPLFLRFEFQGIEFCALVYDQSSFVSHVILYVE